MNSKERVAAALARRPVDRVPLGFYAVDHDIVSKVLGRPTYVRNKIAIQIALWEGRRAEVLESLQKDTVEFYTRLDCADLILPKEACPLPPRNYEPRPPRRLTENRWEDAEGRVFQAEWAANEIQCVYEPPKPPPEYRVEDFAVPADIPLPDPSEFEACDYVLERLGRDRYVATFTGGVTALTLLGGTENGLMLLATQPEVALAASRRAVAIQNARDRACLRPGAAGALMEQDMAGTNGPLVSPAMFRELALPFLKERIAHVKQSLPQVIFHNCGNNVPLMDMLIEAGVDGYQSLQTTAGMEIGMLKRRFGHRLCFWGGVALETLIRGGPDDVRREVRTALERGAPGGGFILGPSHSIAMNTRYENFMALVDEFVRLRDRV